MMTSSKQRRNVPPPVGSAAAKASMYSRFIPREELDSFAAWKPGDLGGPINEPPVSKPVPEAPKVDPAKVLADQMRAARQSGYQDGYRDGLVALDGFKQSFAQQATSQVGTLLQSIGEQLDALQQQMAESVAIAATQLARQIVRSELGQRPDAVARVAQEAVDTLLLSARHITLRVHPDDQPLVEEGAGEALAARGGRIVADASIARGGCLVESNIGVVDASIETRWRRAAASLGRDEAWDLFSDDSSGNEPSPDDSAAGKLA